MIELTLQNITCGSCVRHITKAVATLDPHAEVQVDVKSKLVRIDNTQQSQESLEAALTEAGYPPFLESGANI